MSTLLIAYDLNSPGQDYSSLIDKIKSFGAWWHHLDSTWLVVTNEGSARVRDLLRPHLDTNDELLVIDITGDPWATQGLPERANKWLHDNLS
jgi:hypothetical protein